jgi:hypothetical protein
MRTMGDGVIGSAPPQGDEFQQASASNRGAVVIGAAAGVGAGVCRSGSLGAQQQAP